MSREVPLPPGVGKPFEVTIMPITAECPVCGHKGPVPDTFKGKKVKCHQCHNMFTIGGTPAAAGARPGAKQKSNPDLDGSGMDLASSNGVGPGDPTPNPFDFDGPAPPPPQPTRKSAPGTAKNPAAKSGPTSKSAQEVRRPLKKKRNQEPLPISALILGGLATVMGLGAIIVANKGMVGLASVPVGGFGLLLAIGGVATSMGRGWPILIPVIGLLVCLGSLPVGGYRSYQLIASGALSVADEQAKKATTASESKQDGPIAENKTPQPPTQPNLPPPPPISNPDEWMDAKQGFRLGKVVVKVVGMETDSLRSKDGREVSKNKHALIRIDITNVSNGDVDYFSWATRPPQGADSLPQLTDSNGAEVKWAQPDGAILINQVSGAETIQAGRTVSDILVYAIPSDTTNYLRLELPGRNVGEMGKFRLQMPKVMLAAFVKGLGPDNPMGDAPPKQGDARVGKFVQDQLALLQKAKSEAEKTTAIGFIGGCGRDAAPAAPELARFLKGHPDGVRVAAANALANIGPGAKGQVAALQAALKDEFWRVKAAAARALGNIGPDAKAAIPDLLPLIASKDEEVPQAAREAVRRIDPSKLPKK
jgi:hypothetical protein